MAVSILWLKHLSQGTEQRNNRLEQRVPGLLSTATRGTQMSEPKLEELTAEMLLGSASLMEWFTTRMAHMNMMNMSGSSFRNHPQMYWKDGILITNPWSTQRSDSISIASDPSAKCFRGSQESCGHGNPYPSLSSGQFVSVWQGGKWTKEGPWQPAIISLLESLIASMRELLAKQRADKESERLAYEKKQAELNENLMTAWGSK